MSDEIDRGPAPDEPGVPDRVSDDGWTYTRVDWSETSAITEVAEAVAETTDRDVTDFRPIYEVVDPDALDALVETEEPQGLTVRFAVAGVQVSVSDDGTVGVRPPENGR